MKGKQQKTSSRFGLDWLSRKDVQRSYCRQYDVSLDRALVLWAGRVTALVRETPPGKTSEVRLVYFEPVGFTASPASRVETWGRAEVHHSMAWHRGRLSIESIAQYVSDAQLRDEINASNWRTLIDTRDAVDSTEDLR